MAVKTYAQLSTNATTITNNNSAGSNTQTNVGGQFQDMVDSGLRVVKITLTPSQINSSNTTPIQVLAAQGINIIIRPLFLTTIMAFVSVPYASTGAIGIGVGSAMFPLVTSIFTTAGNVIEMKQASNVSLVGALDCVNAPMMIKTSVANPTSGDSPVDFYITYQVLIIA